MNDIEKLFNKLDINVLHTDKRYIQAQKWNVILTFDSYDLFSMSESDAILTIKQRFAECNVFVSYDNNIPIENTNSNSNVVKRISIKEKKNNIRKILETKNIL